jgi:hypothetical protein
MDAPPHPDRQNAYVWLDQLSKSTAVITRLDQIPTKN